MFKVQAFFSDSLAVTAFNATAVFNTEEECAAAIKAFPKWVKVKPSWLHTQVDGVYTTLSIAMFRAQMTPAKGNEANESGAKRIRRFLEVAGTVKYDTPAKNSFETLEAALAAL